MGAIRKSTIFYFHYSKSYESKKSSSKCYWQFFNSKNNSKRDCSRQKNQKEDKRAEKSQEKKTQKKVEEKNSFLKKKQRNGLSSSKILPKNGHKMIKTENNFEKKRNSPTKIRNNSLSKYSPSKGYARSTMCWIHRNDQYDPK